MNIQFYQSDCIGKEKLVILLHGWNSRAKHLKIIFQEMDNFIALDLPGFGESDLPPVVWGVAEYANFLRRFLEKLEIEKPILAGHSFGGSVILKYLANGGRAEKIILVSPSGIRKRGMKIWFYKIVAKIAKSILSLPGASFFRDKIRIKAYKMIDSEDYIEAGALTESYKKIIREDLSEDMKKIQIKTILIWGEKDVATPLAQGELMQKFIKNSKLYIIKTAGHFSFVDQPEEFKKIFLREINAD
ncbi:MAG: alpha/beta hydrolase [Parcubacteria group bacterium]